MIKLSASVFLIFFTPMISLAQTYTWPENGHTYQLISSCSWSNCRATAQGLGGDLVIVNDLAENEMLQNVFTSVGEFYIGATDSAVEGLWKWVDGTTICSTTAQCQSLNCGSYCNWRTSTSEPNNSGGENFGVLVRASNGQWNDWNQALPAVIEIIPACSGGSTLYLDGNYTEQSADLHQHKIRVFASRGSNDFYRIGDTGNVILRSEVRITMGIGFGVDEGGNYKAEIKDFDCI